MKDEKTDEIKIRYRCSNCKNLEGHHMSNKKRKCKKCGENLKEISEKDYHHYKHKLKKEKEREKEEEKKEEKKETTNKNQEKEKEKEKKKNSDKTEEKPEKESVKTKHKLKKNLSTKNLEDKSYKNKKEEEITITNKPKKDDSKKKDKKKKNRHKSVEKLGTVVSNVVSNLFNNPNELGTALIGLNDLDLSALGGSTIIVNSSNLKSQVIVNNKEIDTDVFDPIFNSFGVIFDDNFVNNFLQNFQSSNNYEEIQNFINDMRQNGDENGSKPVKKDALKKLKKFKLTEKYYKNDKDGKQELPNCCICLSEIEIGKDAMLLPCGHLFHYKCSYNWLKNNNTCPMCRFEIK